jgi:coenzyme F420 biosynthesis associated uncharacterized protein
MSLRALARPLPASAERRLLDWEAVRHTAHARTGETGPPGYPGAAGIGAAYDRIAAEMAPLMAEVCQAPVAGFPTVDVLDRRGFVDANLVIVQRLFEPVERLRATLPESRMTALSRGLLSRYVGELFGFLSGRVLGQYDPVLMLAPPPGDAPRPALSLVEPNVVAFEKRQDVPAANLRRWLVLHELTHAWQFEAHPWLREHIAGTMSDLLMSGFVAELTAQGSDTATGGATASATRKPTSVSTTRMLRSAIPAVRTQLGAIGRIQAVMSVAEGYSNYVMHRVGERHIDDFEQLERGFHDRQKQRSLLEQLVLTVTGMRMKLRQYELGEHFAEEVVTARGLTLLNRVWEGPDQMPTLAELREPRRWIARVG